MKALLLIVAVLLVAAPVLATTINLSTVIALVLFALIGVGGVVAINRAVNVGKTAGRAVRRATGGSPLPAADQSNEFFQAARRSPFDPLACLRAGDIDGARQALQKLAYEIYRDKKKNPQRVQKFTQLMCMFVQIDPLFWRGLQAVEPVIAQAPGSRQTALYSHMTMSTEEARYVLYFAAETGHLHRVKQGNSYLVYLPHQAPIEERLNG